MRRVSAAEAVAGIGRSAAISDGDDRLLVVPDVPCLPQGPEENAGGENDQSEPDHVIPDHGRTSNPLT